MSNDSGRLKLVDLLRLLNSTPLGEVIAEHQLKNHRNRAGLRIGGKRIDLLRYVAWLVVERHKPKQPKGAVFPDETNLLANAAGAAALVALSPKPKDQPITSKQQAAIAAMLSTPSYAEAAKQAGVSEATIYRWLNTEHFRAAFRQARRELTELAVARVQAAAGQAVDVLVNVARSGRRDSDRVRAATTLLTHAYRGLEDAELIHGSANTSATTEFAPSDVLQVLGARLKQINESDLPAAEKARLTGSLADTLLRAYSVDVLDKRLEALQSVLIGRKEPKEKKTK